MAPKRHARGEYAGSSRWSSTNEGEATLSEPVRIERGLSQLSEAIQLVRVGGRCRVRCHHVAQPRDRVIVVSTNLGEDDRVALVRRHLRVDGEEIGEMLE